MRDRIICCVCSVFDFRNGICVTSVYFSYVPVDDNARQVDLVECLLNQVPTGTQDIRNVSIKAHCLKSLFMKLIADLELFNSSL